MPQAEHLLFLEIPLTRDANSWTWDPLYAKHGLCHWATSPLLILGHMKSKPGCSDLVFIERFAHKMTPGWNLQVQTLHAAETRQFVELADNTNISHPPGTSVDGIHLNEDLNLWCNSQEKVERGEKEAEADTAVDTSGVLQNLFDTLSWRIKAGNKGIERRLPKWFFKKVIQFLNSSTAIKLVCSFNCHCRFLSEENSAVLLDHRARIHKTI